MTQPLPASTGILRLWWLLLVVVALLIVGALLLPGRPAVMSTPFIPGVPGAPGSASPVATAGEICATDHNRYPAESVAANRYLVDPDEWNSTGSLCVRSGGGSDFTVSRSSVAAANVVDASKGPGAYPNISTPPTGAPLPIQVSNLRYATSSLTTTQIESGTYNVSYDVWYSSAKDSCSFTESAELMVWLRGRGKTPFGAQSGDLVVGSTPYHVYEAPKQSSHTLITYAMATAATSVSDLDLRAFTRDAVQRGYVPGNSYLCAVQAGFEIWDGGTGLAVDAFSFQAAQGVPSGAVTSGVPGMCLAAGQPGGSVLAGTCDGTPAQTWTADSGTLTQSGLCLAGSGSGSGGVSLRTCDRTAAQRWQTGSDGTLVNQGSGQCLENPGGGTPPVQVRTRDCAGGAAQVWYPPT